MAEISRLLDGVTTMREVFYGVISQEVAPYFLCKRIKSVPSLDTAKLKSLKNYMRELPTKYGSRSILVVASFILADMVILTNYAIKSSTKSNKKTRKLDSNLFIVFHKNSILEKNHTTSNRKITTKLYILRPVLKVGIRVYISTTAQ